MTTSVTTHSWSELIRFLVLLKQRIYELDPDTPYSNRLPRVGASPEQLTDLESHLGCTLDPQLRGLLAEADGWPDLLLGQQLLGTEELMGGPLAGAAQEYLSFSLTDAAQGWTMENALPVAVADDDRDVVVLRRTGHDDAGAVAWFAGELVGSYPSLRDWFVTVLAVPRRELERLQIARPSP